MSLFKRIISSLKHIIQRRPRRKKQSRRTHKALHKRRSAPLKKVLRHKKFKVSKPSVSKAKPKKRTLIKAVKTPPQTVKKPPELEIGEVTHFFSKIMVCVVRINRGSLRVGDTIHIVGAGTNLKQKVRSLQIESVDVRAASKGKLVGLKVDKRVRENDKVYKVT